MKCHFWILKKDHNYLLMMHRKVCQVMKPGKVSSMPTVNQDWKDILADDHGNVLIADRDNKRLMLFNQNLQFVKNVEVPDFDCPNGVQSIRKIQDIIYVVNRGTKEQPGGVVQLKVGMS